jgi:hypothetical protein
MSTVSLLSPFILSPTLLLTFLSIYHLSAPYFATEKQRAYILSTISAATMSTASIPFVWKYVNYGFTGMYEAGQIGWIRDVGRFGVIFFGSYLFGELFVASGCIVPADKFVADVSEHLAASWTIC